LNKKIFFLIGLPRTGNTLFASLINQNPNIACTANSITFDILYYLHNLKKHPTFLNFKDHNSLDNVINSVFDLYYKDWPQKYIIDRSPVFIPQNFEIIKTYFKQPIKCIILWRDLLDVFASYIKWFENELTAYLNNYNKNTIEEKLLLLMDKDGTVFRQLATVENALNPKYKELVHLVKYNDLVTKPKETLKSVYNFLGIDYYEHYFKNLKQFSLNNISYDDTVVGNNMHTIKTEIKLEQNPYKKMIPQSIIDKYGHIKL
jgi:sulfotransferase